MLTFTLYSFNQRERDLGELRYFNNVLEGLELVEDDYLGGQGTRGSGRVAFTQLNLRIKQNKNYDADPLVARGENLLALRGAWENFARHPDEVRSLCRDFRSID